MNDKHDGTYEVHDSRMIVLFDGVCNLCNRSVHFIVDRDPGKLFRFAPIQSDQGRALMGNHGLDCEAIDSLVLLDKGKAYTHSTGALRIVRHLRAPWPVLYVFILLPRFLRDSVYRLLSRNRYRWFGKTETCRMPTPDLSERFLDW